MEDASFWSYFSTTILVARLTDRSAVASDQQGCICSVDGYHRRLFCRANQPDSPAVGWRGDDRCFHSRRQTEYLESTSTVLERLQVSLVLNVETARALLEDLESSLTVCMPNRPLMQMIQGSQANASPGVRLVIIDSVTYLLAPSLSAVSSHGHAIMTTFIQHLRSMARSYYLAFLVSVHTSSIALSNSLEVVNNTSASPPHNSLSAFASTVRKPALGPSFTFLTDCTVWLARHAYTTNAETRSSIHVAEVFRSRSTVSVRASRFFFLSQSNRP